MFEMLQVDVHEDFSPAICPKGPVAFHVLQDLYGQALVQQFLLPRSLVSSLDVLPQGMSRSGGRVREQSYSSVWLRLIRYCELHRSRQGAENHR
jgi:hypothetical protein